MGCGQSESSRTKQVVSDKEPETAASEGSAPEGSEDLSDVTVTIDEQVLVEQDGIAVTTMEYVTDSIWGDGVKLLLENNSDKDVTVGCNAPIVNDYMISDQNSFWGTAILLYCENNSEKNAGISVDDISINGFMTNPLFPRQYMTERNL